MFLHEQKREGNGCMHLGCIIHRTRFDQRDLGGGVLTQSRRQNASCGTATHDYVVITALHFTPQIEKKLALLSLTGSSALSRALEQFARDSDSRLRHWTIQNPQLREHRGLIPLQMLTGHFPLFKSNDADQGKFSLPARNAYAG